MPTGPNGEKRPQSDTSCAVHVMKIATGEITEERRAQPTRQPKPPPTPGKTMGRVVRRKQADEDVVLWGAGSARPFFYER